MKRLLLLTALLCALAVPLAAQVPVALSPVPHLQFLSNAGIPLASGCVFTYQAGTTTPAVTYRDSGGVTTNTNPIILNAGGFADIWLPNAAFKFTVKSAGGVNCASGGTLWTVDGISGVLGLLNLNNIWTGTNQFNQAVIVNLNANQFQAGTVGNRTTLNFPAPAGNITLNFPSTGDTMVGRLTTDTLQNKTLTSAILNGNVSGSSLQGTNTKLLTAGTVVGTGATLCTNAVGGATTSGCVPSTSQFEGTNTTPVTVTNTAVATNLQTVTINAGDISSVGINFNIEDYGVITSVGGQTITMSLLLDGVTVATTGAIATNALGNISWQFHGNMTGITLGAGGSVKSCFTAFGVSNATVMVGSLNCQTAVAIDTTVSHTMAIQVQWSVAAAGNSITSSVMTVNRIG